MQQEIAQWVNNNGEQSTILPEVKNRPNWDAVKDVLLGIKPISDLGCD